MEKIAEQLTRIEKKLDKLLEEYEEEDSSSDEAQ